MCVAKCLRSAEARRAREALMAWKDPPHSEALDSTDARLSGRRSDECALPASGLNIAAAPPARVWGCGGGERWTLPHPLSGSDCRTGVKQSAGLAARQPPPSAHSFL